MYDRMLHLPLPTLWDMKTGGILSRLSGDVDTTTGLFQMAVLSPATSLVRLAIATGVLVSLNWRLALTALALVPGVVVMSFVFARRVRTIYRTMRMKSSSSAASRRNARTTRIPENVSPTRPSIASASLRIASAVPPGGRTPPRSRIPQP
jgi:ABC-type multidrug transport system fused ATPase/permease subunit